MASERKFVAENVRRVLLKEYLMKEVSRAGFGGLDIQRTPLGTHVILITERPGLVIGRRGQTIKNLTTVIEERYGFEKPWMDVVEVENASLNAQIMAEKLAFSLERGWHFRRAGHSTVRRVMDAGARGCHIIVAGKLTGQRHRTEKFKEGYIKFCGEPRVLFVERGYAVAKLKMGVIGVTVEIMRPDSKLPADTMILNKTEAAAKLPDLFGLPPNEVKEQPPAEAPAPPQKQSQRPSRDGQRPPRDGQRPPRDGQKPADKPADKPGERPARDGQRPPRDGQRPPRDGQKPADKPADKPSERPAKPKAPAEKPADKPADIPAEKPADKPADKPAKPKAPPKAKKEGE